MCGVLLVQQWVLALGMEFRLKLMFVLEKSKLSVPSVRNPELCTIKMLKQYKDIGLLQADKRSCTIVMD